MGEKLAEDIPAVRVSFYDMVSEDTTLMQHSSMVVQLLWIHNYDGHIIYVSLRNN